jgi:CheY-like chemotaxis protein
MPRILVVDDDWLVCSAIRTWIETAGYEVVIADGAESGLNALDKYSFDLMIVDIFMPHMRGFESVRVFHQRAPHVPLVLPFPVTSLPSNECRHQISCKWLSSSVQLVACANPSRPRHCCLLSKRA